MNRLRSLALLAATPLALSCSAVPGGAEGELQVVTSIYPLQFVAERVAGEHAEVHNLTSPGVEAHDLELTVSQVRTLSEADLLAYLREFQPAVDEAVDQNGPEQVLEVTEVVDLAAARDHRGETEEEHAAHAGEGEGGGDPHFWLDPKRLSAVVADFAGQMSELDPDNAGDYESAASDLRAELSDLHDEYTQGLASCRKDTVVVSHDAFGYLERYGVHFEPIAGLSPDAEPSPAHLAELQDLIRAEGVTTVFSETLASPALSESLAGDLGLSTEVLDPIEGLTAETEDEDYLSLMRANLEKLKTANGCS